MGKASRWFRAILGLKKPDPSSHHHLPQQPKEKRGWSFVKSYREKRDLCEAKVEGAMHDDVLREAREVAVVTTAAAATKIQSAFRAYLARRALRALRALVRLQALVRGHIERKRTTEWFQRMQSLLRAQARARIGRVQHSRSSLSCSHHSGPPAPEKFEHGIGAKSGKYDQLSYLKRSGSQSNGSLRVNRPCFPSNLSDRKMEGRLQDPRVAFTGSGKVEYDKGDKVPEVDPGKPHSTAKRRNFPNHAMMSENHSHSITTSKESTILSSFSSEVQSSKPMKFSHEVDDVCLYPVMSIAPHGKISPFNPTRSDGIKSLLSGYTDYYPTYMSYTESSRAKMRSLSTPKQRPHYERSSSVKRYSIGKARSSSAQRSSTLRTSFTSKAYPGSGYLDRLGMPVGHSY